MSAKASLARWINADEAARIAEVDPRQIRNLAAKGLITTRNLPGVRDIYLRESVEALAASYSRKKTGADRVV